MTNDEINILYYSLLAISNFLLEGECELTKNFYDSNKFLPLMNELKCIDLENHESKFVKIVGVIAYCTLITVPDHCIFSFTY